MTHAHEDHYPGNPILLRHLPGAKSFAASLATNHIKKMLAFAPPKWEVWFPNGQVLKESQLTPEAISQEGTEVVSFARPHSRQNHD